MSNLPTVKTAIYEKLIQEIDPKKPVKYRPYFVEEEKSLLTAYETDEPSAVVNTIAEMVKVCTFGKIDIDKLPAHVVDYLFLLIHAKSKGSIAPADYTCNNVYLKKLDSDGVLSEAQEETEGEMVKCPGKFTLKLDLSNAKIFYPEGYEEHKVVMLDDETGIKLKVPSFEEFRRIKLDSSVIDIADAFIFSGVESVFTKDSVLTPGVDFNEKELTEWLNKMETSVTEKLSIFFKDLPYIGLDVPVTCPLCGKKEVVSLKGLEDFFA